MEEKRIKILIADDIEAHRRRFDRILSACEDMEVVGLAATGKESVALALAHTPDIILMDIEMESRTAGIDAAQQILAQEPQCKVIMLTVHKDDDIILRSYQAGVVDYIFKTEEPANVVQGIRLAYNSSSPIRGDIAATIRSEVQRIKKAEAGLMYVLGIMPQLTYSELQVLKLLCQNKSKRQIAEDRVVEYDTVKKQVSSILRKFNKSTTAEVVAILKELRIDALLQ